MTTVADILNLALKDANVIGEGETASAETTQDALSTFNQMLGLWQADGLSVYAQQETSFNATGAQTYAIGSGATVDATRPIEIESAFYRSGGIDYPIQILNNFEEFQGIPSKTQDGMPYAMFYRPSYPSGAIYLYPQPSSGTVHLTTLIDLPEYTSTANELTLPRPYELPVRSNLAVLLSDMMGTVLRQGVARLAISSKKLIQRKNVRIPQLSMPDAVIPRHRFNINEG